MTQRNPLDDAAYPDNALIDGVYEQRDDLKALVLEQAKVLRKIRDGIARRKIPDQTLVFWRRRTGQTKALSTLIDEMLAKSAGRGEKK